ncbi:MAG TPA: DUF4912 domain-containing protein [Candidatus Omnitrophota bacterium]|nr:DUF4912 domain-containing protein [Candidatus Omnitrophota bacterium]HPS37577.1 DUF4912 domain-containing protein [Candidatus Omnitrophota bacterium]
MGLFSRKKKTTKSKKEAPAKKAAASQPRRTNGARKVASRYPKAVPQVQPNAPMAERLEIPPLPEESVCPKAETRSVEMPRELPDNYGDNQIYLLVRDPYWVYSYWEIQHDHQMKNLAKLGGSWDSVVSVLRVYDITDSKKAAPFFDIVLQNMVKAWYLNVQPNHSYVVELGLLHKDGRFICLARSNEVTTPRSGMSEVIDDQWMSVDFEKMYALSGGFQVGKSSAELRKMMEERLRGAITSGSGAGAISSMASPVRIKQRGFHFWLECELIIYGGTEPDAKVTMQGRPVQLRPDGTFTFRYALPDGKFVFDCHAESADGIEERVITPIVSRNTERPAPVFKAGKKS